MGKPQSKLPKFNSPLERMEYEQKQKIKEEKKRKKRHAKLRRLLRKGKKFKNKNKQQPPPKIPQEIDLNSPEYQKLIDERLKKQLTTNIEGFLLNQIMLSIQFYGNYEREKGEAFNRIVEREKLINEKLDNMYVILPNVIDDATEKRVQFQFKHGPEKNSSTTLHTQVMYIVHENVEILDYYPDKNYDTIDQSPTLKVIMDDNIGDEKSKYWKGYVRLKLYENIKIKPKRSYRDSKLINLDKKGINTDTDIDSIVSSRRSSDDIYNIPRSPKQSIYDVIKSDNFQPRSTSSSLTYFSSTEYDYAYITNLNSHQPISQLTTPNCITKEDINLYGPIPEFCISYEPRISNSSKSTFTDDDDSDSDFEIINNNTNHNNNDKYINSKYFLYYFGCLLKERLAKNLNISKTEFDTATWKGASIYTTKYEILPAIACPWPRILATRAWEIRVKQTTNSDIINNRIQWPTDSMIGRIKTFGCYVIPIGYAPKKGKNLYREIEWKIIFPKAERYLELNLSNTQVKIFMLVKLLIKTFVVPLEKNNIQMFNIEHLRTHLFWQCEKNYAAWPEEYLGEVLIRFLRSFSDCISSKCLSDYFLSERNLLENIPESSMIELHEIITKIIENPVMHIMIAYRNLQQIDEFFPKLNYKKLYKGLAINNPLCLIHNGSLNNIINDNKNSDLSDDEDSEDETDKQKGLIGYSQKKEKFDETKRRRTKKLQRQQRRKKLYEQRLAEQTRKLSTDSLDLEFFGPGMLKKIFQTNMKIKNDNNQQTVDIRRTYILELFVELFIEMGNTSCTFRLPDQASIYLDQATRFCNLLREYGEDSKSMKYLKRIEFKREKIQFIIKNVNETGPELPTRISLLPIEQQKHRINIKNQKNFNLPYTNVNININMNSRNINNNSTEIMKIRPKSGGRIEKSVQFNEISFIEPRQFMTEVQINSPSSPPILNGIMKQNSLNEDSDRKSIIKFNTNGIVKTEKLLQYPSDGQQPLRINGIQSDSDDYGDSTEL